jgi:UrcA family protein
LPTAVAQQSGEQLEEIVVVAPWAVTRKVTDRTPTGGKVELVSLSRTVYHADLNLVNHADVMELEKRVSDIAKDSCGHLAEMFRLSGPAEPDCVEKAVASAKPHDYARIDRRSVDRAGEQGLGVQDAVSGVEPDGAKVLVVAPCAQGLAEGRCVPRRVEGRASTLIHDECRGCGQDFACSGVTVSLPVTDFQGVRQHLSLLLVANAPSEIKRVAEETRFVAAVISRIARLGCHLAGQGRLAERLAHSGCVDNSTRAASSVARSYPNQRTNLQSRPYDDATEEAQFRNLACIDQLTI